MPIRFRCRYCNKLLGIARRKAGTDTVCPHCGANITVPPADGPGELQLDLDELDALLSPPAAHASREEPASADPEPQPLPEEDRPLFEREIDAVLGTTDKPERTRTAKPRPAPASGPDALSLDEPGQGIVLSPRKATAIVVAAVVLLILAFAAGYLIAASK